MFRRRKQRLPRTGDERMNDEPDLIHHGSSMRLAVVRASLSLDPPFVVM
jgi:hypothetical protein